MPQYAWTCGACSHSNGPATEVCANCRCPAMSTLAQRRAFRASLDDPSLALPANLAAPSAGRRLLVAASRPRWGGFTRTLVAWVTALGLTALMFGVAVGLVGGGHGWGWNSGAMGCLALMPVNLVALLNAFRENPSGKLAKITLWMGLAICVMVALGTFTGELHYFRRSMDGATWFVFAVLFLLNFQWLMVGIVVIWQERSEASAV